MSPSETQRRAHHRPSWHFCKQSSCKVPKMHIVVHLLGTSPGSAGSLLPPFQSKFADWSGYVVSKLIPSRSAQATFSPEHSISCSQFSLTHYLNLSAAAALPQPVAPVAGAPPSATPTAWDIEDGVPPHFRHAAGAAGRAFQPHTAADSEAPQAVCRSQAAPEVAACFARFGRLTALHRGPAGQSRR